MLTHFSCAQPVFHGANAETIVIFRQEFYRAKVALCAKRELSDMATIMAGEICDDQYHTARSTAMPGAFFLVCALVPSPCSSHKIWPYRSLTLSMGSLNSACKRDAANSDQLGS